MMRRCLPALLVIALAAGVAHADEETRAAREDTWWQLEGRDRNAFVDVGFEMTVDDGNTAGAVGEAGDVELTMGYWFAPCLAAELQLAVGQSVNPGVLSDTRVENTNGAIGAGLRLGLPVRLSPIAAAHIGYRQKLSSRASLTCGADCGRRVAVAMDDTPDQQIYADVEAGLQLNLGSFSLSATVQASNPLASGQTADVAGRAAPGSDPVTRGSANPTEFGFNMQAGVRF